MAADWWSNSEDDDLQKALRASLAEMEGGGGVGDTVMSMEGDGEGTVPEEVTAAYQAVVRVWERDKRIYWTACDTALALGLAHREARSTTVFVLQMVPEIVLICVQECTWADIVEDAVTKEDYTTTFTRILESCVALCVGTIAQGSSELLGSLSTILDPLAQLYTKHARTAASNADCPPSPTLLPSLIHHASALEGPAHILACIEHWPWPSVLLGLRCLCLAGEEEGGCFAHALGVVQQRILARGLEVWRQDGAALAELFRELTSNTVVYGTRAGEAMREIGAQVCGCGCGVGVCVKIDR